MKHFLVTFSFIRSMNFVLWLFLAIFGVTMAVFALPGNLWSAHFLDAVLTTSPVRDDFPPPPVNQRSRAIWVARLAQYQGQYEKVVEAIEPLMDDGYSLAGNLAGQAYMAMGKDAEARTAWVRAGDVNSLLAAAQRREAENKPDVALAFLRGAYEVDDARVIIPLANALYGQGETSEALDLLDETLERHQDSQLRRSWFARGLAQLRAQREWTEALAMLDRWQSEFPSDTDQYLQRGWVLYEQTGDVQAATRQFEEALALDPGNGTGYLHIASILNREKRHAEAEVYYAKAMAQAEYNRGWMLERANNLRAGGELDDALVLYQGVVDQYPDFGAAYYQQAWAYDLSGRYEDALATIQIALQVTDNPPVHYYMRAGTVAEHAGDVNKAILYYEAALLIDPSNERALQSLDRLRNP